MLPKDESPSRQVLAADGLEVTYGQQVALRGVSLEISNGVTALVGPNGSGKSTLLRLLAGVQRPDAGAVTFRGREVVGRTKANYHRRLGFLPQNPSWHGWMTVADVVGSFAWMHGVSAGQVQGRSEKVLAAVDLVDRSTAQAGTLSGGQFQRLMLATSLVHDPEILLLDEPTAGLDPEQRQQFRGIVREASRSRIVLISTHLLDDVATTAERILVLDDGLIVFSGVPSDIAVQFGRADVPVATDLESAYIALLRDRSRR